MTGAIAKGEGQVFESENQEFGSDRRLSDRQIAIFRLAKIASGPAEGWGVIKNISSTGVMLEIHPSFALDRIASIALTDDVELSGSIRWKKDALVGIQLNEVINVPTLLTDLRVYKNGRPPRLPRIHMDQPTSLRTGSNWVKAQICDISPAGIRIKTHYSFEVGSELTLLVPDLGDVVGTVRWQMGPDAGIIFSQRIPISQLMVWLSAYFSKMKGGENYQIAGPRIVG